MSPLVFEAAGGQPLDTVRVPEFFTYAGFQHAFIDRLGDIAERIKRERWVLGPAGEQSAVSAQYDNLPDQMLELYTRDFLAGWRDALAKLRLRKDAGRQAEIYRAERAVGATSPLKQLLESIRDETMLTRERAAPPPAAGGAPCTPAKPPAQLPLFKTAGPCAGRQYRGPVPGIPRRGRRRRQARAHRRHFRHAQSDQTESDPVGHHALANGARQCRAAGADLDRPQQRGAAAEAVFRSFARRRP